MLITEQIVFIALFFISLAFFIFIYAAYPFWSHMPVMHKPYSWLQTLLNDNNTLIEKIPYRNKFVNTLDYQTTAVYDINNSEIKNRFTDLVNCMFLTSDAMLLTMDTKKFDVFFTGHYSTPFITIGKGCVASTPVIQGANELMFISYLASPDKDTTRKLLSTHIFNCRRKNPDIQKFLFKTHHECSGTIPFIQFNTGLYYVGKQTGNIIVPVQQIGKNNWSFIYNVIDTINAKYKYTVWISPSAIKTRSDAGVLWIFAWFDTTSGEVLAAYFLEDAMTLYEKLDYGKMAINLVGTYKHDRVSDKDFYDGLLKCIQIVQKQNLDFMMLTIDDVGHNSILAGMLTSIQTNIGAYYLINTYFSESVDKAHVFISL